MTRVLNNPRLHSADFARVTFVAKVEAATTEADLLDPAFFSLVARQLRPGSIIEVHWDDFSGFAELYVRGNAPDVIVEPINGGIQRFGDALLDTGLATVEEGIRCEFTNQDQWRVVRESDGVVIKSGLREEREAKRQRTVYLKTLKTSAPTRTAA